MAFSLSSILPPILTLVSIYTAQKSYVAITNLQRYEEKSEKAAKHLDKAAHELWKTRVTQASGAGAIAASLLTSMYLSLSLVSDPTAPATTTRLLLAVSNIAVTAAAYLHITGFWRLKPMVPFVEGFNEGIRKTNEIRQLLVILGMGWAVFGGLVGSEL